MIENPPEFRQKVENAVFERLRNQPWFKIVSFQNIESFEIKNDLEGAIEQATRETIWAKEKFGELDE